MQRTKRLAAVFGFCLLLYAVAGLATGAGATSVTVHPGSDTVTAGNATTIDLVVESASGGVGSIDVELSIAEGSIANVSDAAVAGDPETVRTAEEPDGVRIAATGMNTTDRGSVPVASVTLTGEAAGVTDLRLTVAAIGDESGDSYDVTDEVGGELTVESAAEPTPTETDASSSDDDSSDGDGGAADPPTATATPQPTETATDASTAVPTDGATATATPTATPTGGSADVLFFVGGGLVVVLGGIVLYRRL